MSRSWDVFCKVIDNFGDAAVCWRLAQQLAAEHAGRVRLWIDAPEVLHALCPQVAADCIRQNVAGVEVWRWSPDAHIGAPAEIVIDAFGCGLPDAYVASMAQRDPHSLWIILEYLSAEPWVVEHHGLASPHPRLPLERRFFFPGVVPDTGGVLREASLEPRRAAFQRDSVAQTLFWSDLGYAPPPRCATVVSLFGYRNPAAEELLSAWAAGAQPVVAAITRSQLRAQVSAFFGTDPPDGTSLRRGNLEARFLPFLPQPGYDELLWASDWNFVRGEDSFVRAQWAALPMVWHIYPQRERAHRTKLDAFLHLYCENLEADTADSLRSLWYAWNEDSAQQVAGQAGAAWRALAVEETRLRRHAMVWAGRLAKAGELAGNLAQFCEDRLK